MLAIKLVQQYNIPIHVAKGLVRRYGGRAWDVVEIAIELQNRKFDGSETEDKERSGVDQDIKRKLYDLRVLVPGFSYIAAEVVYAVRYEWAVHADDILGMQCTGLVVMLYHAMLISLTRVLC